jgi:hypothetical protein
VLFGAAGRALPPGAAVLDGCCRLLLLTTETSAAALGVHGLLLRCTMRRLLLLLLLELRKMLAAPAAEAAEAAPPAQEVAPCCAALPTLGMALPAADGVICRAAGRRLVQGAAEDERLFRAGDSSTRVLGGAPLLVMRSLGWPLGLSTPTAATVLGAPCLLLCGGRPGRLLLELRPVPAGPATAAAAPTRPVLPEVLAGVSLSCTAARLRDASLATAAVGAVMLELLPHASRHTPGDALCRHLLLAVTVVISGP